jgi:hypothetical protein
MHLALLLMMLARMSLALILGGATASHGPPRPATARRGPPRPPRVLLSSERHRRQPYQRQAMKTPNSQIPATHTRIKKAIEKAKKNLKRITCNAVMMATANKEDRTSALLQLVAKMDNQMTNAESTQPLIEEAEQVRRDAMAYIAQTTRKKGKKTKIETDADELLSVLEWVHKQVKNIEKRATCDKEEGGEQAMKTLSEFSITKWQKVA